ncbi:hypothetical protein LTR62_005014 [Meristemomyces frigidus]|uniref:Uncharacterized protein n=1 Tax=Meristemomyces frigidus TaxID=1508187 RepID=A0AAN7TN83_9PEZI|nr:hypothetical protein LTR62_005014 [Meristemomyces frigidus]
MKTTQVLTNFFVVATAAQVIDIAGYADTYCSELVASVSNDTEHCVTSAIGFTSLEIYSPPSNGEITLWSGESCEEGESYGVNLMYLNCVDLGGFVARSVCFEG